MVMFVEMDHVSMGLAVMELHSVHVLMEVTKSDVKDNHLIAHQISIGVQVHFTPAPGVFLQATGVMMTETVVMVVMNETAHHSQLVATCYSSSTYLMYSRYVCSIRCDGNTECFDKSDEENCPLGT